MKIHGIEAMKIASIMQHEKCNAGGTIASIYIEGKTPYWHAPACQPCVHVEIINYQDRAWQANCYLELADLNRTQWSVCQNFSARDEAATEAARFAMVALALLRRSLAGESIKTPGQRRERAARTSVQGNADWQDAQDAVSEAQAETLLATTDAQRERLQQLEREARAKLEQLGDEAVRKIRQARHWSEYVEIGS